MEGLLSHHLCQRWKEYSFRLPGPLAFKDLLYQYKHKRMYADANEFSETEVLAIAAKVDEATIQVQTMSHQDILQPLNQAVLPPFTVIHVVTIILLLFKMKVPPEATPDRIWRSLWTTWMVKNIDLHIKGWEWMSSGEPEGLFTRPYALDRSSLDRIGKLLDQIHRFDADSDLHQTWPAYFALKQWVFAVYPYLHMMEHCLDSFPAFIYVQEATQEPPKRKKQNIWFETSTLDGLLYYYNRETKEIVLDKPIDYDGKEAIVTRAIEGLIYDALMSNATVRAEMEKRREKKTNDETEWVQGYDDMTQRHYYYNFETFTLSFTPPKAFLYANKSVAWQSVILIQAAYRRKQARKLMQKRRELQKALPSFGSSFY